MAFLAGFALFVFGCFIGLSFPDLDQKFYWNPVLVHRSILTHNPFLPLLLWFVFRRSLEPAARLFLIGLSLATAVHLGFDLYPRDMYGFALVHVPFQGRTSATFSEVWLAAGMVISLGLATRLIRSMGDFVMGDFVLGVLRLDRVVRRVCGAGAVGLVLGAAVAGAGVVPGVRAIPAEG